MMKVSIVIATYNAANYIESCLTHIVKVNSVAIEVIIIDGKSNDDTLTIVQGFRTKLNLQITSEKDHGIYDAMNKGCKLATGEWILFLGADDEILPDFGKIIPYLTQPKTIYFADGRANDKFLNHKHYEHSTYAIAKHNICHQNILYPKVIFEKYSYQLKYKVYADWALNISIWGNRQYKRKYINLCITNYSEQGFSFQNIDYHFINDKLKLIRQYLGYWVSLRYKLRIIKKIFKNECPL